MQTELTTGKGLVRTVSVTVPATAVDKHLEQRLATMAKTAKIDGFRPGKVPAKVLKERAGSQIEQDVARQLVEEYLPQAIKQHDLNVAGQPRVTAEKPEDFKVAEGADFKFEAEVEIYPDVTPKNYTGLKLVRETAEPSEELVQTALTRLETQMQTFATKEGKAAKGDQVTITGQGYVKADGKEEAFPGGNLQNFKVVLGSNSLIPGFEDGLVGSKAGDEVDVEVSFPADYHAKELAGKPSVFKLKVEEIAAPKAEPLTDESVKQLGLESLDKLKDILKQGAARDLAQATEQRLKRQLLDALEESNKGFELPQGLVNNEHQGLWRAQLNDLQQKRMPVEALGNIEEAIANLKTLAERRVRLGLVLAAIAKAEKIEVTDAEVQAAIDSQIAAAGPQAEQARQYFAQPANRQQLVGPVLEDKVTGWIIEKSKVEDKTIPATELLTELQ